MKRGLIVVALGLALTAGVAGATSWVLDPTFGSGGKVITPIGPAASQFGIARSIAIQSDGKIVVAGDTYDGLVVARYLPNGSLDPGFGTGGLTKTTLGGATTAGTVLLQPDGKLVVSGEFFATQPDAMLVARYNSDGSADTSFGVNGLARFAPAAALAPGGADGYGMALLPDGKFIVAGDVRSPTVQFVAAVARLNPDGSLDSSFATDGFALIPLGATGYGTLFDIEALPDGRLVGGGVTAATILRSTMVALRLTSDGALDSTFGTGGVATISPSGASDFANAMVRQPDGRIVLVGNSRPPLFSDARVELARLNADGSPDATFGTNGGVVENLPGYYSQLGLGATIDAEGRIVVAGAARTDPAEFAPLDFLIERFLPDGSLDTAFGNGGYLTTDFSPAGTPALTNDAAYAVAMQGNGKLIAAGFTPGGFALARYRDQPTPQQATQSLIDEIVGAGLAKGTTTSLIAKLVDALAALAAGDTATACSDLAAFVSETSAQSGKKIPAAEAAAWILEAQRIEQDAGC